MDRTFQKFLQSKIDLSSVGVEFREDNAPYFCTPKGAFKHNKIDTRFFIILWYAYSSIHN